MLDLASLQQLLAPLFPGLMGVRLREISPQQSSSSACDCLSPHQQLVGFDVQQLVLRPGRRREP
jgi:hypothetical protein